MNNTTLKKSNEIENSKIFKSSNPQIIESSLLTLSSTGGGACQDISAVGRKQQFPQSNSANSAVGKKLSIVNLQLSEANCPLSIVNCKLSIVNCTLLIVFCLFFGSNAWGQCTGSPTYAIIGTGESNSTYPLEISTYSYSSSVTQSIYRYDELQAAGITRGVISSISYQCTTTPGNSRLLTIYMAHVDDNFCAYNYDAQNRHYVTTGLTRVVNAKNVTFSTGWNEIVFDNTFTYQGGKNLLVVVIDHTRAVAGTAPEFKCYSSSLYLTLHHAYNSTSNVAGTPGDTYFTPNWTSNYTSEGIDSRRPYIQLKISKTTCTNNPTNITFQEHPSSVDISWDANGASKWEVRYGTHGFAFPSSGTSVIVNTNSCTISGLAANTQYDFYIRSVCGSCYGEYTPAYSFMTLPSSFDACSWGIRINIGGDGYDGGFGQFVNDIYPFNTENKYNYSQIIYTADEFGIGGGFISGITIKQLCGGSVTLGSPLKIYMGNTSKNSFASTSDWIDPSTLQEVYSSSLSLHDGMIHIQFSTPFEYDVNQGGNLVVAFYDSGAGTQTTSTTNAYYARTSSSDYRSMIYKSDSQFTPGANPASNRAQLYLNVSFDICSPRPLCDYVPVSLSATPGDRQVELTWDMVTGATYKLYYGVNNPPTDGWVTPQNVTSPYMVPRLTNGQTYHFAIKPTGTGDYCADNPLSSTVSATPECNE